MDMASKSEKTRERILNATVYCVTHLGVERTSHAQIAKRAKVSRSLVAHYFPSKSKMFPEVIRYVAANAYAFFQAHEESTDPKTTIYDRLQRNLEYFTKNPDHYKCIVLLYYRSAIDSSYRKINTILVEAAVKGLEEPLKVVLHPELARQVAESLHNELIASIQKFYMIEHNEQAEMFVERMGRYFCERLDALIATPA